MLSSSLELGCGGRQTWLPPLSLERIQSRTSIAVSCEAIEPKHTPVCTASFSAAARPITCFASAHLSEQSQSTYARGGNLLVIADTRESARVWPFAE